MITGLYVNIDIGKGLRYFAIEFTCYDQQHMTSPLLLCASNVFIETVLFYCSECYKWVT
jgi:hypothetical protein